MTNNTGAISDYNFDAYGNKTSGGTLASPYGYRGYYQDSETGLYYLNARYYDPSTQQFTQEDTYWGNIKDPKTLNLYSYCQGNPIMFSDPTGHWANKGNGNWAAESGDTLWGLAVKLYGNGSKWKSFGFTRDPKTLRVGEVIHTGVKTSAGGGENSSKQATAQSTQSTPSTPSTSSDEQLTKSILDWLVLEFKLQ